MHEDKVPEVGNNANSPHATSFSSGAKLYMRCCSVRPIWREVIPGFPHGPRIFHILGGNDSFPQYRQKTEHKMVSKSHEGSLVEYKGLNQAESVPMQKEGRVAGSSEGLTSDQAHF